MNNKKRKQDYLYIKLKNYLYELLVKNSANENYKLPTEKMLSEMFNISRITARKALDELSRENLILRYQGKGTFINPQADFNSIHRIEIPDEEFSDIKKIGIILPSAISPHTSKILEGIFRHINQINDDDLFPLLGLTHQSQELQDCWIRKFLAQNVSGLLIYPADKDNYSNLLLKLTIENFPIVLIDRYLNGLNLNAVTSENFTSTYNATQLLIRNGHKKILVISANPDKPSSIEERLQGYQQALEDNGIKINNDLLLNFRKGENNELFIKRIVSAIVQFSPTAVLPLCYSSSLLLQNCLRFIPQEVMENLSFMNFELESDYKCKLINIAAKISQQSELMGEKAIRLLLDNLEQGNSFKKQHIQIPCLITNENRIKKI